MEAYVTDLIFKRAHALEAIRQAKANGLDWLYTHYPKPAGQMRRSTTGFLMHDGTAYPVKPLGRLANEIAGAPMIANPITNVFRKHFQNLKFQLIESPEDESEEAAARQRRLAEVWERPGQARFRRSVFALFGARCLVTGCENLIAVEAAHVLPVANSGCDEGWNGIPLRADLHRLFDAGLIDLMPNTWTFVVKESAGADYAHFQGHDVSAAIMKLESASQLAAALRKRAELRA